RPLAPGRQSVARGDARVPGWSRSKQLHPRSGAARERHMIYPKPLVPENDTIRLEPLTPEHGDGIAAAVADGNLWELWFTSVPTPEQVADYIGVALAGQRDGHMLAWAVREVST